MRRPLLFLDVDGPLIPFGRSSGDYETFTDADSGNPLLSRVDPALGPRLLALGCDLVWATTWLADANECVAPLLGLPPLPVLDFPDTDRAWVASHHPGPALLHTVDASTGLTGQDLTAIATWLTTVA